MNEQTESAPGAADAVQHSALSEVGRFDASLTYIEAGGPVVAILNWLERRVEQTAHAMEDAIIQVFTENLAGSLSGAPTDRDQQDNDNAPAGIRAIAAGE